MENYKESVAVNVGNVLYCDCMSGISGDMLLGALVELLPLDFDVNGALAGIALKGYRLETAREKRGQIAGVKVRVISHEHEHRHLSDILEIIEKSELSEKVRQTASRAFSLLAEAEGKVHGVSPEEVHFHEVGAVDSIVDIVGACVLMEQLGWPRVVASTVNVGSGTVECAHGVMPVPAPATAQLLQGIPVRCLGEPMERTTPTGAVLLRTFAQSYGPIPEGMILKVGVGLGERESADLPNVLRVLLMEDEVSASKADTTLLLETNLDDMNPQDCSVVVELLLEAGALDVWYQPIFMKKGRPALLLSCLCKHEDERPLAELILRHTTTLGVRSALRSHRTILERVIEERETSFGTVRFKQALLGKQVLREVPEFDDLLRISREKKIPLPELRALLARISDVR